MGHLDGRSAKMVRMKCIASSTCLVAKSRQPKKEVEPTGAPDADDGVIVQAVQENPDGAAKPPASSLIWTPET